MGKGLPRSTGRATASPQRQEIIKQTIAIRDLTVTVDGATGVGFGSSVIAGLPEGNLLFLGAVAYLTLDAPASGISATFNGDYGIGSTPASDATLSGADVDVIASTAIGPAVATVSPRTRGVNATQAILDNTDGSLELNLNVLVDDADISADDVAIVANGELFLCFVVLGDD